MGFTSTNFCVTVAAKTSKFLKVIWVHKIYSEKFRWQKPAPGGLARKFVQNE